MKRKEQQPIPIPPRVRSLIGCRFGNLTVKFFAGMDKHRKSYWCCECACVDPPLFRHGHVLRMPTILGRVPGGRLLGNTGKARGHPQNMAMPKERRVEICEKMRKNVRHRKPCYSVPAGRAAELLGVSVERIEIMAPEGKIGSTWRKNGLWVSSHEVMALVAEKERTKKRCPIREIFRRPK